MKVEVKVQKNVNGAIWLEISDSVYVIFPQNFIDLGKHVYADLDTQTFPHTHRLFGA